MRFITLFLAVLLGSVNLVVAAEPAEPDSATLNQTAALIRDFANAKDSSWLESHRAKITPAVARASDFITMDAIDHQRPDISFVAARFAAQAHKMLNEPALALESMLNMHQSAFMLAERPDQYAEVRKRSLESRQEAARLKRPEYEFLFLVIAADASYFQSTSSKNDRRGEQPLLDAVRDIAAAAALSSNPRSSGWMERFVSLATGIISEALGSFHMNQRELTAALKAVAANLERAIPAGFEFKAARDREKTLKTAMVLARYSYEYGTATAASARLTKAEERAKANRDTAQFLAIRAVRYRGERDAKRDPNALRALREEALAHINDLRPEYRSRAGRIWAAYRTDQLYGQILVDQLADRSPDRELAFSTVEAMKARLLLDYLHKKAATETTTPETRRLEGVVLGFEPSSPTSDLLQAELQLVSQLSTFGIGQDLDKRMDALRTLEAASQGSAASFQQTATPEKLSVIQQALEPQEAILEYVQPYNELGPMPELWMLLIRRKGVKTVHVNLPRSSVIGRFMIDGQAPIDSGSLEDLVSETRFAIRSANEQKARAGLKQLHELLIQPLAAQGAPLDQIGRLIIVPHGVLHYVPFAALLDRNDKFLISRLPITMAPSASVWHVLQARKRTTLRWLAFANPAVGTAAMGNLPLADQEVDQVVKLYPAGRGVIVRHKEATLDKFRTEAPTAGLLHIASHGDFPDDNALDLHAILLAPQGGRARSLLAEDVRTINLSASYLVALSVCNGGLYRIGPSDEPYGLLPAFLQAGAQNVMGTLWPLDDQFSRDFMIEFYKHLDTGGPATAYQKASLRFIADNEYIRHWAGYVLVGPGRPALRLQF